MDEVSWALSPHPALPAEPPVRGLLSLCPGRLPGHQALPLLCRGGVRLGVNDVAEARRLLRVIAGLERSSQSSGLLPQSIARERMDFGAFWSLLSMERGRAWKPGRAVAASALPPRGPPTGSGPSSPLPPPTFPASSGLLIPSALLATHVCSLELKATQGARHREGSTGSEVLGAVLPPACGMRPRLRFSLNKNLWGTCHVPGAGDSTCGQNISPKATFIEALWPVWHPDCLCFSPEPHFPQ